MAISAALKRFWASNEAGKVLVNTFQIKLTQIGDPDVVLSSYSICDYGDTFTAKLEDLVTSVDFLPVPMGLSLNEVTASTEQSLKLTLDSLDGQVYDIVKQAASLDRRNNPIYVIHRIYLDTDTTQPALTPPTQFIVTQVTCTLEAIAFDLSVKNLPTVLAGEYYTTDRFPGLRV